MGSQGWAASLPEMVEKPGAWDHREQVTEKSDLLNQNAAGAVESGRMYNEKEQSEEMAEKSSTLNDRPALLRFPKGIRNTIYNYTLSVPYTERIYHYGLVNGLICLADEPGYPPKLCSIAHWNKTLNKDANWNEDYFTEDDVPFWQCVRREVDVSRVDINQLKYVCRQLYEETRGSVLRINAGKKMIFHGTRRTGSSPDVVELLPPALGYSSGIANFVLFWEGCSPKQRDHIRNVDIIELPFDGEHPKPPNRLGTNGAVFPPPPRTWLDNLMALEFRELLKHQLTPAEVLRRSFFRRRCAELTGGGSPAAQYLYSICKHHPALHIVVRYNEYHCFVDDEYVKRLCTYRLALRGNLGDITLVSDESKLLRGELARMGGKASGVALGNLRMTTSVNCEQLGAPDWNYFWCAKEVAREVCYNSLTGERFEAGSQRVEAWEKMFDMGV